MLLFWQSFASGLSENPEAEKSLDTGNDEFDFLSNYLFDTITFLLDTILNYILSWFAMDDKYEFHFSYQSSLLIKVKENEWDRLEFSLFCFPSPLSALKLRHVFISLQLLWSKTTLKLPDCLWAGLWGPSKKWNFRSKQCWFGQV